MKADYFPIDLKTKVNKFYAEIIERYIYSSGLCQAEKKNLLEKLFIFYSKSDEYRI